MITTAEPQVKAPSKQQDLRQDTQQEAPAEEFQRLMFHFDRDKVSLPRQKEIIANEMKRLELMNPGKDIGTLIEGINEVETQTGKRVHTLRFKEPVKTATEKVVTEDFSIGYKPDAKIATETEASAPEGKSLKRKIFEAVELVGSMAASGTFLTMSYIGLATSWPVGIGLGICGLLTLNNSVDSALKVFSK